MTPLNTALCNAQTKLIAGGHRSDGEAVETGDHGRQREGEVQGNSQPPGENKVPDKRCKLIANSG